MMTTTPTQATAVLVDDHASFREGLKMLFEVHGFPRVVGEASGAQEAFEMVSARRPDIVVLDLVLNDGENGISVAHGLLQRDPSQRILFLSMVKEEARVADALEVGAFGYVTKDQSAQDLIEAVRAVAEGRRYVGRSISLEKVEEQRRRLREDPRPRQLNGLTAREREVFDLTVAGLTARSIGERLGISPRTVETHRARIQRKLGVHSAADLVRIAARAGVLA
jgi:RNA polymerase sigma factor (sigma-70 family)